MNVRKPSCLILAHSVAVTLTVVFVWGVFTEGRIASAVSSKPSPGAAGQAPCGETAVCASTTPWQKAYSGRSSGLVLVIFIFPMPHPFAPYTPVPPSFLTPNIFYESEGLPLTAWLPSACVTDAGAAEHICEYF